MATIKEIAELAKVSPATVSRVLNQDETLVVTPEVRNLVFKIAHDLKYVPPKMRHAKKNRQLVIGVADWHLVKEAGLDVRLESLDYSVTKLSMDVDIRFEHLRYDEAKQVDGIIGFGSFSEEEMNFLRRQSYCMLFVNSNKRDYEFDQIVMDYDQGVMDLVEYLITDKQYRSIGYIGGIYQDDRVKIGVNRLRSLEEILKEKDFYKEEHFWVGELSRESGKQLAENMIASGDIPEVIVLGSEEIAEGVIEVMKEHDYRIPKDVAVIIYRDIETSKTPYVTYTSLEMLPDIVWTTAIKLLLEQVMEGRKDTMKVYLPTRLKIGDSA